MFRLFNKVKPCSASTWVGDQIRIPRVAITFFFLFFPFLFQGDVKDCRTTILVNVVSSIYQLFVPHFERAVLFVFIYREGGNLINLVFPGTGI